MATNKIEPLFHGAPKILIPYQVHFDIKDIVNAVTGEVGWIGEAVKLDDYRFRIEKVTVPEQGANSGTTEIFEEDYGGIMKLIEEEPDFDFEKWRYWGHSHGNITSVTPSSQDHETMKSFAESCEWFVGTIHNKDGSMYGYFVDTVKGLYYTDIQIVIEYPARPEPRDWKAIVKERVGYLGFNSKKNKKNKNASNSYDTDNYTWKPGHHWDTLLCRYVPDSPAPNTNHSSDNQRKFFRSGKEVDDTPAGSSPRGRRSKRKKGEEDDVEGEHQSFYLDRIQDELYDNPPYGIPNFVITQDDWEQFVDDNIVIDGEGLVRIDGEIMSAEQWHIWKSVYASRILREKNDRYEDLLEDIDPDNFGTYHI